MYKLGQILQNIGFLFIIPGIFSIPRRGFGVVLFYTIVIIVIFIIPGALIQKYNPKVNLKTKETENKKENIADSNNSFIETL